MEQLQIFSNPVFGSVRTIEEKGNVLFCANDVAKALGYAKPRNAVAQHCRGALKRGGVSFTTNQHGKESAQTVEMNFIPEGDVYRLIARSKLPAAEKFERWVFDEVLPSIRQTGGYNANLTPLVEQLTTITSTLAEVVKTLQKSTPDSERSYRHQHRRHSIISSLDLGLRAEVEDMLCSGLFTYSDIQQHLQSCGVDISLASISRYARFVRA